MQVQQGLSQITLLIEVWVEGYPRKLTFEVDGICYMVHGIVQNGIDLGENVVFSDLGCLAILFGEFIEGPIGDCCRFAHHLGCIGIEKRLAGGKALETVVEWVL